MKWAEYLLQHRTPVLYDSFAVQTDERILATYPNLIPGLLFLRAYAAGSFLGLNLLRIFIFVVFFAVLLFIVYRSRSSYSVLLQIAILALAMTGTAVLRPDELNYVLFTVWIALLEKLYSNPGQARYLGGLLIVEAVWVSSHPLFFYHGLSVGGIYGLWQISAMPVSTRAVGSAGIQRLKASLPYLIISFFWLLNPLGWRALQSLFINMLDPGFNPDSCRSFVDSLVALNTYEYFLIPGIFLIRKPWRWQITRIEWVRYVTVLVFLLIPAFIYERCLPFPFIFLILTQATQNRADTRERSVAEVVCCFLTVCIALYMLTDRHFILTDRLADALSSGLSARVKYYRPGTKGIGIDGIEPDESIREVFILSQVAASGNCAGNDLKVASPSVWHCPDKPFFMHGHAAVMNVRGPELREFLARLGTDFADQFMDRYAIRTVALTASTEMALSSYASLSRNLELLYIDPYFTVLARKGTVGEEQRQQLKRFYSTYRPGLLDSWRFASSSQMGANYLLLWLSAEITGNDGSYFLSEARQLLSREQIELYMKKLRPLLPS